LLKSQISHNFVKDTARTARHTNNIIIVSRVAGYCLQEVQHYTKYLSSSVNRPKSPH